VIGFFLRGRWNPVWLLPALCFLLLIGPVLPCQAQDNVSVQARVPPRAIAYQRSKRILGLTSMVWNLLGMGLLLRTGLSARGRDMVYHLLRRLPDAPSCAAPPPLRALALFFLGYLLAFMVWRWPAGLTNLAIERHFGFARQSVGGMLWDSLLFTLFELILLPVLWGGYWLYQRSPRRWWLWLWAALVPLLFVQIVLQPVLIAPAFHRYTPLEPGPLREKILTLAARSGITGGRVFVENTSHKTRHVNAYVTGIGPTIRIVLNDTALQELPEDQLLAMMGHEIGHYVEGHLWIKYFSSIIGAGVFLGLAAWLLPRLAERPGRRWGLCGIKDIAALPLILLFLSVFLLAQAPIENYQSRILERRADAFALRLTRANEALIRLFIGFVERDYSDPDPPRLLQFWFGSHPTLSERIAWMRRVP
jgi:Zn-dependent protease with chaperone function